MTDNEKNLIELIRSQDNTDYAMEVAVEVILAYLKQPESSQ